MRRRSSTRCSTRVISVRSSSGTGAEGSSTDGSSTAGRSLRRPCDPLRPSRSLRPTSVVSAAGAGALLVDTVFALVAAAVAGSTRTASSTSVEALRNSRIVLPRALPTSGSLPGPMISNARTRTSRSSIGPMLNGMFRILALECVRPISGGRRDSGLRVRSAEGGSGDATRDVDEQAATADRGGIARGRRAEAPDRIDVAALRADTRHEQSECRHSGPDVLQLAGRRGPDDQAHVCPVGRPLRRAPSDVDVQRLAVDVEVLNLACAGVQRSGTGRTRNDRRAREAARSPRDPGMDCA